MKWMSMFIVLSMLVMNQVYAQTQEDLTKKELVTQADQLMAQEEFVQAAAKFDEAVVQAPAEEKAELKSDAIRALTRGGQKQEAKKRAEEFVQTHTDVFWLETVARTYPFTGASLSEIETVVNEAEAKGANHSGMYAPLAWRYGLKGDEKRALQWAEKAIQAPDNHSMHKWTAYHVMMLYGTKKQQKTAVNRVLMEATLHPNYWSTVVAEERVPDISPDAICVQLERQIKAGNTSVVDSILSAVQDQEELVVEVLNNANTFAEYLSAAFVLNALETSNMSENERQDIRRTVLEGKLNQIGDMSEKQRIVDVLHDMSPLIRACALSYQLVFWNTLATILPPSGADLDQWEDLKVMIEDRIRTLERVQ